MPLLTPLCMIIPFVPLYTTIPFIQKWRLDFSTLMQRDNRQKERIALVSPPTSKY